MTPILSNQQPLLQKSETRPDFVWQNPNSDYLVNLRHTFRLEEKVSHLDKNFDKALALQNWVHGLWSHHGFNKPINSDPITIINLALNGESFRCVEYSIVLAACLNSISIPSRVISLMTKDVETRSMGAGHKVVEAYIEDLGKWVMFDPQANVSLKNQSSHLSALELKEAIDSHDSSIELLSEKKLIVTKDDYLNFIHQYLFFMSTDLDNHCDIDKSTDRLMLLPNNLNAPKSFQGEYLLENIYTTSNKDLFYQKPIYK